MVELISEVARFTQKNNCIFHLCFRKADDLKEKAINLQNVELTIDIWPVQKHLQVKYFTL